MEAGRLRHPVTLEAPTRAANTFGEPVAAWSPVAEAWASVEPLSGRELWQAQQVQSQVSHRVRLRGPSDVAPDWRLRLEGRTFQVLTVLRREERTFEVELLCVEA